MKIVKLLPNTKTGGKFGNVVLKTQIKSKILGFNTIQDFVLKNENIYMCKR